MECPKRCPKGLRCSKKIRLCEPKTLRKPKPIKPPKVVRKRCYSGTRRSKGGDCENAFIALCKKHLMVPTLDHVVKTTWLRHKDCNIFMIGEIHNRYEKCTPILDALKAFTNEVTMPVDLLIELYQHDAYAPMYEHARSFQMSLVRMHFAKCIKERNCPLRVHWADPGMTNRPEDMPEWLKEFSKEDVFSDYWTRNPKITFQERDVVKMLTHNRVVVKEIVKASKLYPQFKLIPAAKLFMEMYEELKDKYVNSWEQLVTIQLRYVMDFYTVARILKSNMKNVVFYAGNLHTTNVTRILQGLGFEVVRTVDGECIP
jgi:hypothetical protein